MNSFTQYVRMISVLNWSFLKNRIGKKPYPNVILENIIIYSWKQKWSPLIAKITTMCTPMALLIISGCELIEKIITNTTLLFMLLKFMWFLQNFPSILRNFCDTLILFWLRYSNWWKKEICNRSRNG